MKLKNKLLIEAKNDLGTLLPAVVEEILSSADTDDEIKTYIKDLLNHGCQSGMVSGLIYYKDTHAFFDTHYDDIEQLRQDLEENLGQPLEVKSDLKNYLAWLAFEETARKLSDKIGVEV